MLTLGEIRELSVPIPPSFRGFDPRGELRIYTRNLPHWRQSLATYFVTFRQADSIPQNVLRDWKVESAEWHDRLSQFQNPDDIPKALRDKYDRFRQQRLKLQEQLLDSGLGSCQLREPAAQSFLGSTLKQFHRERYDLFGFVIMPNHCHLLVKPFSDRGFELETILKSWKSWTSREFGRGRFWQEESYDQIVRDEDHYRAVARYLLKNPVKANLAPNEYSVFVEGVT